MAADSKKGNILVLDNSLVIVECLSSLACSLSINSNVVEGGPWLIAMITQCTLLYPPLSLVTSEAKSETL